MSAHGHIHPRKDGTTKGCGGPTACVDCAREALAAWEAGTLPKAWANRFSLWSINKLAKHGSRH